MFYQMEGAKIIANVTIGEDSSIWYNSVVRGDHGTIIIGKCTNVQDCSVLHASPGFPLSIGDYVTIGHRALLHGCTIHSETLIGMGAIVMNGAVIGSHCIVGAGSLITQNKVFPDGVLIMGSPAKIIRPLKDEEIKNILHNANVYVSLAKDQADFTCKNQ